MTKRNLSLIIIVILILAGIFAGTFLFRKWNQPLGESLALPTLTPSEASLDDKDGLSADPTVTVFLPVEDTPEVEEILEPTEASTNTPFPTDTPEPLCGGPAAMTVLALGIDSGGDNDYLYGLAMERLRVNSTNHISMARKGWVIMMDRAVLPG